MKKRVKKLVLAKETVRRLGGPGLAGVLGAAFSDICASVDTNCNNSFTCGWSCTCQSNVYACPGSQCGQSCSC